jgi:ABC-2 type transport system permease protein
MTISSGRSGTLPARPAGALTGTLSGTLTGTGPLVRLVLRRDRIRLPVWVLSLLAVVYGSAAAVQGLYDTPGALARYAATMGGSPAVVAMSGPPTALGTLGGITVYEINTTVLVGMALMAIFLVVRHTRGEEEAGRTEMLRSTVVGRHAPTVAALLVVGTGTLAVAAGVGAVMLGLGLPAEGSLAYAASLAAYGLCFTAVGACAAQVTAHARGALGLAGALVGAAFALRAAGDVGNQALSWLSPMGWVHAVRPFGDERWWPVLLMLAVSVGVLVLGAELTTHRDVGSGLVPPRAGPEHATPRLGTAVGLAARLQRGALVGWCIGVFVAGVSFGSLTSSVEEFVELNEEVAKVFTGTGSDLVDAFLGTMLLFLALAGSGFTISSVLRLRAEEAAGRVEPLLATGLSRRRWAVGALVVTLGGTVLVALAGGLGTGLAHGLASGDLGDAPRVTGAALAYVPATLVLGAVGVVLVGWLPRFAVAVWAGMAFCFLVGWLAEVLDLPAWVRGLSPYTHVDLVPAQPMAWGSALWMTLIAVGLVTLGIANLSKRDIG